MNKIKMSNLKMKNNKVVLSLGLIITFSLYVFLNSWRNGKILDLFVGLFRKNQNVSIADQNINLPISSGKYKDGVFIGSSEDVYYGLVQVQASINSGVIDKIDVLKYPTDRDNSIKINDRAIPILKSEAIRSQSANVDVVSGATQTSKGFIKSLNNALAQAQKEK